MCASVHASAAHWHPGKATWGQGFFAHFLLWAVIMVSGSTVSNPSHEGFSQSVLVTPKSAPRQSRIRHGCKEGK
jgi:hypothetical protein